MAGEPARDLRPQGSSRPAAPAKWQKLGTIERIMRDTGGDSGEQLHALEKAIAVYLLGYARTSDDDPCAKLDIERPKNDFPGRVPSIEEGLHLTGKTLRNYLDKLIARKLIEVRRDRANGAATIYLRELVRAYAEDRFGKDSRTVVALPTPPVREKTDAGSGNFSDGSGNFSGYPQPVRETFPVPLEHLRGQLVGTSSEHTALARRLGFKVTKTTDGSEHAGFFANRPLRFAAAHQVEARLLGWTITPRRIRKVLRDYPFAIVAAAVGYVIEQVEQSAQRSLLSEAERKRLDLPVVENTAALFEASLERGWMGTLPGFEDDPESAHAGGASFEADVWTALREMIRRRVPPPTYELGFKLATLRCAEGAFVIRVANEPAAIIARKAAATVSRCLDAIGYPNAVVTFTSETA
jgi:hypothetical protein